jgi:transcription initiation factor TFIIB
LSSGSEKKGKKKVVDRLKEKLASSIRKLVPEKKKTEKKILRRMASMRSDQFGIMTTIGKSPDGSSRHDNLKKWHKITSAEAYRKKYNIKIVKEIRRICSLLHLPKNAENSAILIYRKARIKKITNGRRYEWIAAACVYASCRMMGFPRSLEEFAKASDLHPKNIGRTYLKLKRILKLPVDLVGPQTQIHRIALNAKVSTEVEMLAAKLLKKQDYGGKPETLAATALYVASVQKGFNCTQTKLAKAAGICENTLRNCYQEYKQK